ncbi:DUF4810 domain-containing protein [Bordetella hinzii]|uniref:DUF4810 domain-containing protein n=1 Tax=Bordetella hinzii TaxID=103855 RepID=A0AAN1VFS2_9BORD|nr:DUF4810 domain-containing protein [Bordetella hinzii]AKQ57676.1 hypothetical protein ACR54_04399 [Bordetella hinzii]AKQ62143.1 hypothetical protein ACR55_04310 [Bordetella hinzii]AZW16948.1 DUF4810 domain-containing protein [Bordetella hinzii]KXA71177.1 hypothetical protein AXA74_19590 [Bordetella hinzii LMG 13501]MBZ0075056.1 DUF4810 domain-containing protein [Bordetella hinzii]
MAIPRLTRAGLACALVLGLSACAQQKPLYSWQSYQPSVYAYLKDDGADPTAQLAAMEKNVETARSAELALPPGFRAHMALLYLKAGQDDKAVEQFNGEKNAFPESAPFMDFLMSKKDASAAGLAKSAPDTNTAKGK